MPTCATCRWWAQNPERDVPPEPATTAKILGLTFPRDGYVVQCDRLVRYYAILNNESGTCSRMPKTIVKHRDDFCGEHQPSRTSNMTDVEKIARGLTKAQREALLSARQDNIRHAPYHIFYSTKESRAAWRSMINLGFVTEEHPGFDLVYQRGKPIGLVGISELGLAVRAHLLGEKA